MGEHTVKTFLLPKIKVDNVAISGVFQVGDSQAIFPHLDSFAQGAGRGAGSFNTQYFPRSRTRLHYANQTDLETSGDQSIVEPAPDPEQFQYIQHMYQVCNGVARRFAEDGHSFVTSTQNPIQISDLFFNVVQISAVVQIGSTHCAAPVVHSISRGLMRGAVVGAGGPVGAIGAT